MAFMGDSDLAAVEVEVPPGPLGILLNKDALDRPMIEAFVQLSPSDPLQRGAVELSGQVPVGSLLVAVNETDFIESDLSFDEVSQVLRETSHLPRTLKFHVPHQLKTEERNKNVPLSHQFVPRRGLPPKEEESEEEKDDESDDDVQLPLKQVAQTQPSNSNLPLTQQFASRRGPPPNEDEEEEEESQEEEEVDKMGTEAVRALTEDKDSERSTSWTCTGSNLDRSSTSTLASIVSSEKLQQMPVDQPLQLSSKNLQPTPPTCHKLTLEIDKLPPSLPTKLSFRTMAALAETRHFDSDDSSEDDNDTDEELDADNQVSSWKPIDAKLPPPKKSVKTASSFSSEQPENLSPQNIHQPLPVSRRMASNVSSGTIATSLMVQTNQLDRDDSIENDVDAEYVTVVASPGPLGLNLDGGELNRAVVLGFAKLRDGSNGPLERNGYIVHGSIIVRINGEDVSRASLNEVRMKLGELVQRPRTLVFRLPAQKQQKGSHESRYSDMRQALTLSPFEEDFDKRRKLELALVMHYDKLVLSRRECWFCIDVKWMARWVDFVARGGPEPGPITNETLLHPNWRKMLAHDAPGRPDTPRDGLVILKDYRVVSPMVWCLLAELHGPGEAPLLARYLIDIHAEALSDGEINIILERPRPKATVLANGLRDKCLVRRSKTR